MALQQKSTNVPETQAEPVVSAQQALIPGTENAVQTAQQEKAENLREAATATEQPAVA